MKLTEYIPREPFLALHNRQKRWACIVAHRRAGKTVADVADLVIGALECQLPNPQFAYIAPLREQAKRIAWEYLKDMCEGMTAKKPNESELKIEVNNSAGGVSKIYVAGSDRPDALRGLYFDGVVMDEIGQIRPSAWYGVLRATLSDRNGWAIWTGTPAGKNMFWNLREEARLNPETHLLIEAPASETKIIDESELEAAKAMMTEADYLREYECSFDASVPGTYFANLMNDAYHENRIGDFPAQSGRKVEAVADLGYTDSTSWWIWQTTHEGYRIVMHYEDNGREIQHYIDWLKSLPYDIEKVWLPHDAKAKSLQTGRSIIEVFLKNGIRPSLVPELSVQDGIEAARQVIPKCVFDESATYEGTEHLRAYRRSYDEKTQTFRNRPRHDEHSHSADSFRYLALAAKNIEPKSSTIIVPPKVRTRTMYEFTLDDLWKDCGPRRAGRIGD